MICYKDMTFCSARCDNLACFRNEFHIDYTRAYELGLGVAKSDFSIDCPEYQPEMEVEKNGD